ncbi:MAG: L-aspartate oxidase [Euryarchaeota archaeon]|jgi:L-aspartate oxidase|nr:L-aspartate oxidase [Euryarchaeota archaeon]MBF14233.1 L-aspartate oxidase [Euryarchaeota archaeon]|tara:strand:- start:620 stop:2230 length:1611 start_codon:yes stop_codon:yes gene_type:complete
MDMPRVLIIGTGIAGLFAALRLANQGFDVEIITKQRPKDSSTNWAQGGIAAILDKTNLEEIDGHIKDTLDAGDGLCDEEVVRMVVEEAGERIRDLLSIGVVFERNQNGAFQLAQEGGHSSRRILHAKDATGKEIERALTTAAREHERIMMRPNTLAIDLIQREHGVPENGVCGVWALDQETNEVMTIEGNVVILATGGAGQLWERTTNPSVSTGDGIAMAYRTGASVTNMAFVQFHPTALVVDGERPFLITEALRGEGAVLLDSEGYEEWKSSKEEDPASFSFTLQASSLGSMATRDVVARAIDQRCAESGASHVYLITEHLDKNHLDERFPMISNRLRKDGIILGIDPLPVSPAAHYIVGGIEVDEVGSAILKDTNKVIPGLFAIGEVACTGMHGANRLASNSLLEAVVFAHRCSSHLIETGVPEINASPPSWRSDGLHELREHGPVAHDRATLNQTMRFEVGVSRRFSRLQRAIRRLRLLEKEIDVIWKSSLPSREIVELRNMILVGILVAEDANNRKENRGLHYNKDLIKDVE